MNNKYIIDYTAIQKRIKMEKELIEFLKYVKEVHVDAYGYLEICDSGDELDTTVAKSVKDYLKSKEI